MRSVSVIGAGVVRHTALFARQRWRRRQTLVRPSSTALRAIGRSAPTSSLTMADAGKADACSRKLISETYDGERVDVLYALFLCSNEEKGRGAERRGRTRPSTAPRRSIRSTTSSPGVNERRTSLPMASRAPLSSSPAAIRSALTSSSLTPAPTATRRWMSSAGPSRSISCARTSSRPTKSRPTRSRRIRSTRRLVVALARQPARVRRRRYRRPIRSRPAPHRRPVSGSSSPPRRGLAGHARPDLRSPPPAGRHRGRGDHQALMTKRWPPPDRATTIAAGSSQPPPLSLCAASPSAARRRSRRAPPEPGPSAGAVPGVGTGRRAASIADGRRPPRRFAPAGSRSRATRRVRAGRRPAADRGWGGHRRLLRLDPGTAAGQP